MNLLATIDPWYVAACTAVPIAWGTVVHLVFVAWQRRSPAAIEPSRELIDPEADEANLP